MVTGEQRGGTPLLAWALLGLMLLPCVWTSDWGWDEATTLWEAARIAEGGVIYRDFFESLPPLAAMALGAVYRLTGPTLLAAHAVSALAVGTIAWLMAKLGRAVGLTPWAAMVPGYLYVAIVYWPLPFYYHHVLALALVLAVVWLAIVGWERPRRRTWLGAGFLAGLTFFMTQTDGFLAWILLGCAVVLGAASGRLAPRDAGRAAGASLAGVGLSFAAVLGWLAANGALRAAWQQAWVWPMVNYKHPGNFNDVRWLTDLTERISPHTADWINVPYYYANFWLVCTPYAVIVATVALALAWLVGGLRQRVWAQDPSYALLLLLCLGMGLVCQVGRADYAHTRAYAGAALLGAWVAAWRRATGPGGPERRTGAALLLCSLAPASFVFLTTMQRAPGDWLSMRTPDARYADQPAFAYLLAHTAPGEPIISLIHGGQFYRTVRPSATRYPLMTPPEYKYHTAEDRQVVLQEIASRRAKYVIIASTLPPDQAPRYTLGQPLVGYHYEATRPLMFHGKALPQLFYRRDD